MNAQGQDNAGLLENFAGRSLHDIAVIGKQLTAAFYDRRSFYSYWNGCSTGGRQGLMMAQRYPDDFDGISAAAPAINRDRFIPAALWITSRISDRRRIRPRFDPGHSEAVRGSQRHPPLQLPFERAELDGVMHAHGDALDFCRTVSDERWTSLSPAATIEPGERTGTYRIATDGLIVGEDGSSRVSAEDHAVALLDEIEQPRHIDEHFTVGY
ncbi:tannase/feruloyl esterase family alpha/beta hydrolase [Streptomyces sp. NPDC086777]|uniref:NAD(P)-dependent oxidoreductase n=1 Tax=Streptomyces sp. NPDC086777 TaxID=3154866 RepID=UPI00344E760E